MSEVKASDVERFLKSPESSRDASIYTIIQSFDSSLTKTSISQLQELVSEQLLFSQSLSCTSQQVAAWLTVFLSILKTGSNDEIPLVISNQLQNPVIKEQLGSAEVTLHLLNHLQDSPLIDHLDLIRYCLTHDREVDEVVSTMPMEAVVATPSFKGCTVLSEEKVESSFRRAMNRAKGIYSPSPRRSANQKQPSSSH